MVRQVFALNEKRYSEPADHCTKQTSGQPLGSEQKHIFVHQCIGKRTRKIQYLMSGTEQGVRGTTPFTSLTLSLWPRHSLHFFRELSLKASAVFALRSRVSRWLSNWRGYLEGFRFILRAVSQAGGKGRRGGVLTLSCMYVRASIFLFSALEARGEDLRMGGHSYLQIPHCSCRVSSTRQALHHARSTVG